MKLITNNPFRIAGIPANASARETQRQKGKLIAYSRVGREITTDYDFTFLDTIERTEETLNKAFSDIQQNQDKINHALFWFLNASPFDNTAIEYLKNENKEKAVEIWEKVTRNKEINPQNFSAFNNLGTYKLLSQSQADIKEGIEAKIKLIESEIFKNFVESITDNYFKADSLKQIEKFIDELLAQFNNQYTNSQILELFSNCKGSTQKYLSKKFTEERIYSIEKQIEKSKDKRKTDKEGAYKFGLNLAENSRDDLSAIKDILGEKDLTYKSIADKLANEILQCGIDYFNESQKNGSSDNYLESSQKLAKLANKIVVGKLISDRVKDNLITLEKLKNSEIEHVIQLLYSIKKSYSENGHSVLSRIGELISSDNELLSGEKRLDYHAIMNNIDFYIDWDKANTLVLEAIDGINISEIKYNIAESLRDEFLGLINWYKNCTLDPSQIDDFIDEYENTKPKLSFELLSSEVININNDPFYSKFFEGIRVLLKLEVFDDATINFNVNRKGLDLKKIFEDSSFADSLETYNNLFESFNPSNKSILEKALKEFKQKIKIPRTKIHYEYHYNESIKLNRGLREIILPCNKSKEVDKNKFQVEIYVEDSELLTKTFVIKESPSKKLKKEIEVAEKNLKLIQQTNYFANEIGEAERKMNIIKVFKFFRPKAEKMREIQSQQSKIENLKIKSTEVKKKKIKTQEEKLYKLKMELSVAKD